MTFQDLRNDTDFMVIAVRQGGRVEWEAQNESGAPRRKCEACSNSFGSPINMAAYRQALGIMLEVEVRAIKHLSLCRNPFETISKDYEARGQEQDSSIYGCILSDPRCMSPIDNHVLYPLDAPKTDFADL